MNHDVSRREGHEAQRAARAVPSAAGGARDRHRANGPLDVLQRQAGNRMVVDLLRMGQAKLEVGPAGDHYEQEADAVARQVVASLRNATDLRPAPASGSGDTHPAGVETVSRQTTIRRWAEVGAAGGALGADTEAAINSARGGGGAPLDSTTRTSMEGAFGADFSGVRVHTGSAATDLNARIQAKAFTVGSDIFFRGAAPDVSTSDGQELLAHELTHTVQQGGAPSLPRGAVHRRQHETESIERMWGGSCCHVHGDNPIIQRHSSWEHSLLGDAKPDVLAKMGTWQDLIDETSKKGKGLTQGKVTLPNIGVVDKAEVMHVLTQEMSRIALWQTDPPTEASTDDAMKKAKEDPTFGVVVVRLPADKPGKQMLITYGELNTLADFYGSLEVMQKADPGQRKQIVQSVRKETFLRLREIYDKLNASLTRRERKSDEVKGAQAEFQKNNLGQNDEGQENVIFSGAATPDLISGKAGQADLLAGDKPLIGQGTGAKGDTNKYGAGLARNACHFVPESWHAWADCHKKALEAAQLSFTRFTEAQALEAQLGQQDFRGRPLDKIEAETAIKIKKSQCSKAANEALLHNGFGDHYLQDSYASGHMINKTQIMQWYVEYIDTNKEWDYFKDKNWRKVQQMAYGQEGLADPGQYDKDQVKGYDPTNLTPNEPRNPQSVENLAGDDWTVRFNALGLQVPESLRTPGTPERAVMETWQLLAASSSSKRKRTGIQLTQANPTMSQRDVWTAVTKLMGDGVVRTGEDVTKRKDYMKDGEAIPRGAFAEMTFLLREDYIPSGKSKVKAFKQAQAASKSGDDSSYQKMAQAVTYGDYIEFMSSGFIQKATNALHDTFCASGLTVLTGLNAPAFKVYGDDAMFSKESSEGVKESGITANMSRDSIMNIINTGQDGGFSTKAIMDRLPSFVRYDLTDGEGTTWEITKSIRNWHNSNDKGALKDECMTTVFPKMSWSLMQKMIPGVAGSSLGKITRDKVHGNDAF